MPKMRKTNHDHQRRKARTVSGGRPTVLLAPLPDTGKQRCEVCRNSATVTPRGYLRSHKDLFGNPCFNKKPRIEHGTDQD